MSFTYLPSVNAIRGSIAGVNVAIDFRAWNDGGGNRFGLIATQEVDHATNQWDYWGNAPGNPAGHGNAGLIWSCATDSLAVYRSPAMPAAVNDQLVNIMNAQGAKMLTDWIGVINQLAAAIYGATPVPVPPSGPFATWQDGAAYLGSLLPGYTLTNGQMVPK